MPPFRFCGIICAMKKSILRNRRLLVGLAAAVLSASLLADTGKSNNAVVFLRPGEMSFWHTATNSTMSVPVDMPPMASKATLSVCGVKYKKSYEITEPGSFAISLPSATSPQDENVYNLTLSFDDGTVRTAQLGLVQGYAKGADASTRVLSPKGGAKWGGVKRSAVLPIPCGMTSVSVNGSEIETGLGGDRGWMALALASGEEASLLAEVGGEAYSAGLLGQPTGLMLIFR